VTIEFQLARAFTAQSKWADPKIIKGGKATLTADDVRAAVSMALSDHPFAYYALMWKWCDDENCKRILQTELNDYALVAFHELQPNDTIRGGTHWELVKFAAEYFCQPEIGERLGEKAIAEHMGVHMETFRNRYRAHFKRVTGYLFDLELTALQDYKQIMRRDD
jgi:hypothetical protein